MRHRDRISLAITPLLLRIGLAAVFLWAGLPKFDAVKFEGEAARTLIAIGAVKLPQPPEPPPDPLPPGDPPPFEERPPAPPPDDPSIPDDPPPPDDPEAEPPPVEEEPTLPLVDPPGEANSEVQPADEFVVWAPKFYGIALRLHNAGHPFPKMFAWLAAFTETVGAVMILLGLLSRIWGAAMAVVMIYAFWLTVLPYVDAGVLRSLAGWLDGLSAAMVDFDKRTPQTIMFQLVLFLSSLAIMLGGPGLISVDRALFGPGPHEPEEEPAVEPSPIPPYHTPGMREEG